MPVFTFLWSKTGEGWRDWTLSPIKGLDFKIGNLFGVFVDFILISILLYLLYIKLVSRIVGREAPNLKECPHCCGRINPAAKKCPFCTGDIIVETRGVGSKNTGTKNRRSK